MNHEKNNTLNMVILVVGIILFLITFVIISSMPGEQASGYKGLISQFQVVISTVLVTTNRKRGYIAACVLELISAASSILKIAGGTTNRYIMNELMIPACTIVLMSIIFFYLNRSETQQTKLREQYENLMDTKRIMQNKNEALQTLAYSDRLTGMHNKRSFCKLIEEQIQIGKPFTIIYLDIDDFKSINDTFGPKKGDVAMKIYAERIASYCSSRYPCARVSSDEYGILLTKKQNESELLNLIEQLRKTINKEITVQAKQRSLTASYGIVSYPSDGSSAESLLEHAVMAFYNAKASGKDKACFFSRA